MSRGSVRTSRLPAGVRLFYWVRLRAWQRGLRDLIRAPVKLAVVVAMWSLLLIGVYALSYRGIRFVYDTTGLGPFLLSRLWFLFLFVVIIMLAVSQFASAHSTLVRAAETRYWMTLPVSARTLCRAKWTESSFYSAWAVAVLVLPVCLAYLIVLGRPLWIVGWMITSLLLPLIGIVTALSTIVFLVWLRWFGRVVVRRELLPIGLVMVCGSLFWLLGERQGPESEVWFVALQSFLPRMQIAMSGWLPSSWTATALEAGLNSRWVACGLYTVLLWTTALLTWRVLDHVAAALLLRVLQEHAHPLAPSASRRGGTTTAARLTLPWGGGGPFTASLAKDILLMARDPVMWSQALMFFGILGAYFANIHRLAWISIEPKWRLGIASLNLACTLLILGSMAVRFVFPQMSLEGRGVWLLRLAPHGMRRLLFSKLCLYGAIAVVIIEGLLTLSAQRLGIPIGIRWWLAGIGVLAGLTIVGLAVGMGAWWMDVTAQDAARIVSSSNGALVLVFVLCYVGVVVAALVESWVSWQSASPAGLLVAGFALVTASLVAGIIPVCGGLDRLERLECTS